MSIHWHSQAEFIAKAIDPRAPRLWLVELGAGRRRLASIAQGHFEEMRDLAPGDFVRLRFRAAGKTPRIIGYSPVDRDGNPTRRRC